MDGRTKRMISKRVCMISPRMLPTGLVKRCAILLSITIELDTD